MRRGAAPDQDAGKGAMRVPTAAQYSNNGDVICLSDDEDKAATTRPKSDTRSGNHQNLPRAEEISSLLIKSILAQESRAKRYLDALDRSLPSTTQ